MFAFRVILHSVIATHDVLLFSKVSSRKLGKFTRQLQSYMIEAPDQVDLFREFGNLGETISNRFSGDNSSGVHPLTRWTIP